MFTKVKYIITKDNEIVVFGELMQHSDFRHLGPIRAGFISFGVNKHGNPTCSCYGRSVSLQMDSDSEKDTAIAKRQLNMLDED
jgi:hypothetical protein